MTQHLVANLEAFAAVASTGLALVLAIVSFLSYQRMRNRRALFIGSSFVVFFVKGVYLIVQATMSRGSQDWVLWVALLDLVTLLCLYFAIRSR
jgi:hypothetical protein